MLLLLFGFYECYIKLNNVFFIFRKENSIMKKMLYGTQYYRFPTPLKNEWEEDIANMGNYSLDTFQIRINWRANEIKEGVYNFDDVDELVRLAKKHNKKIIIKFLLECAPQYIFDKYEGTRVGPRGEKIRGGYHGAFYGGWQPCFSNPKIQERAIKFIQEVVKRYKDEDNLLFYNAWNEIRNRPIEDCFCPYCKKDYQSYLKKKFITIEHLNKFYGAAEESFETIDLPSTPHGYWDIYEFKKFRGEYVNYQKVRMVYDAIKEIDKKHQVMCHVGFTSGFQTDICDCVNDFYVSKAVDFWGTSIPFEHHMETFDQRMDIQLLIDFIRSVNKEFVVHELYPSLGRYILYDTPYELKYKIFKILSRGSKGICYWQYRSERVGHESDCSGIMYMNGKPRKVATSVKEGGDFVNKYGSFLFDAETKKNQMAILFDFDSLLLSEIEDAASGPDYIFASYYPLQYYTKAHQGLYRLLNACNYEVDYLSTTKLNDLSNYKVVFVPSLSMLNKEKSEALEKYVSNGGTLILEDGFGLRTENTWCQPYNIDTKMMDAWLEFRIKEKKTLEFDGINDEFGPYTSVMRIKGAKTLGKFSDGEPAIQELSYGKGRIIVLGFSLGYTYSISHKDSSKEMLNKLIEKENISKKLYSNMDLGIEENRLTNKDEDMIFLFNTSDHPQQIEIKEEILEVCSENKLIGSTIELEPKSISVIKVKNN